MRPCRAVTQPLRASATAVLSAACRWQSCMPAGRGRGSGYGRGGHGSSSRGRAGGGDGDGGDGSKGREGGGSAARPVRLNATNDEELSFATRAAMRDDSLILTEVFRCIPPNGAIAVKSLTTMLSAEVQEALSEKHGGLGAFLRERKQMFLLRPRPTDGVLFVAANPLARSRYATRDMQKNTMRELMGLGQRSALRRPPPGRGRGRGRGGGGSGARGRGGGGGDDSGRGRGRFGGNDDARRRPPSSSSSLPPRRFGDGDAPRGGGGGGGSFSRRDYGRGRGGGGPPR